MSTAFGPRDEAEACIYAEAKLRVAFQHRLQTLLNRRGVSRAELARRLGLTTRHVAALFAPRANPRLKTIARVFRALT